MGREGEREREERERNREGGGGEEKRELTPIKWLRHVLTSKDPIHSFDPTRDGSLSPTSTRAC